ncbi:hypothetical protein [Nibricoccus aquaticus]|nr:hypothetical protein [Nibricoccus aquaticus]
MNFKTASFIAAAVFILWVLIGLLPLLLFDNPTERGTFGDMFGMANALFSGLALAGVVCAILLQREELSLQRRELELTRDELRKTSEAQTSSANSLIEQQKLGERNAQILAYTALLQSYDQRISAEKSKADSNRARGILYMLGSKSLSKERDSLEQKLRELIGGNRLPAQCTENLDSATVAQGGSNEDTGQRNQT